MNWVSLPVALMAAICFNMGLYYILMFLRMRHEKVNLAFAMCCLTICCYDIFCVGLYNASSVAEGMFWQRFQFASLALFSCSIGWFVYYSGKFKSKKMFIILNIIFLVLFVLGLTVRSELTLSLNRPLPKHVVVGNIIDIRYNEADPGLIYQVQFVLMIAGFVYILFLMLRFFLYGDRKNALPILIAMIILFFAAVNDVLIGAGIIQFIFLFEYAFMLIILSMSYVLITEFVDLHDEVRELNRHLDDKVKARTIDLLLKEIGTSLYVDLQNELLGIEKIKPGSDSIQRLIDSDRGKAILNLSKDPSIIANFDTLLDRVLSKIVEISGAAFGYIFIANDKKELDLMAPGDVKKSENWTFPDQVVQEVFNGGEYLIADLSPVKDGSNDDDKNIISIPIFLEGQVIGVCYLEKYSKAGDFTERDAKIIMSFISQVADAIGTALIYKKIKSPDESEKKTTVTSYTEEKIKMAIAYISENYKFDISREGLAASIEVNPDHLGKAFKVYTGKRISDFINEIRIKEAAQRLRETDENIIDIAFSVGFESLRTFNRVFLKIMKITPNKFREQS